MKTRIQLGHFYALAVFAILLLTGCAVGVDFVRPQQDTFKVGISTEQEVQQKMGKPYHAGVMQKNGETLQFVSYAYASMSGETLHSGAVAARSQGYYFHQGIVVGTEFISSFKADGTDFDESKIEQIQKGKTSQAEVIQLLGKPSGEYVYPMIARKDERSLVYVYSHVSGSPFDLKTYQKSLVISYNLSGMVTDVNYSSTGSK